MTNTDPDWWRGGVFYQIYPRSFLDTTGNGVGDIQGMIEKLDYLGALGIDGIWVSPLCKSPMADFGYDISDYRDVDPLFGSIEDFRVFLGEAHKRDIKVILDMVLSHTSNRHQWFLESKQDTTNPKADWYVWADPKPDGSPPNNWLSVFGGAAWTFDVFRGQYYFHNFLKEQPDLNYNNPDVQAAILNECRYWLDFGVDGFRLDVINFCTHDAQLRDNPLREDDGQATQLEFKDTYSMQRHIYDKSRPENFTFVRALRALVDEYEACMTLAEIGDDDPVPMAVDYTNGPDKFHTAYSFALMTDSGPVPDADFFRSKIEHELAQDGESWPSWAMSNHDVIRVASRWSGTDYDHDPRLSKLLLALLCSLRGTPFIYQGEELGLPEADIDYEDIQDPWGKYLYPKWKGRDGFRTPIPWDDSAMAGFTDSDISWLPIAQTHRPLNVQAQHSDDNSVLNAARRFLKWRKTQAPLVKGEITFQDSSDSRLLIFDRVYRGEQIRCIFNLSNQPKHLKALGEENRKINAYGAVFIANGTMVFTI